MSVTLCDMTITAWHSWGQNIINETFCSQLSLELSGRYHNTFHIFLHEGFLLFIHWLSKLKSFFFNFKVVYVCMNVSVALIPSCTWVGRICCYLLYLLFWLHGRLYSISMFLQVYKTQFYSCLWCTGVAQTSTYELMTLAMTTKHYIHCHKFCNKRKLRTYFLIMQPTWKFH